MKIIFTKEESEKILDTLLFKEVKAKLLNIGIVPEVSVEVAVEDFEKKVIPKAINGYPVGVKMQNNYTLFGCPKVFQGIYMKVWFDESESYSVGFADDFYKYWNITVSQCISHFMILENQKPSL